MCESCYNLALPEREVRMIREDGSLCPAINVYNDGPGRPKLQKRRQKNPQQEIVAAVLEPGNAHEPTKEQDVIMPRDSQLSM